MIKSLFRRRLPQPDGRIYLHPLSQPVTVYRDKWGIPHIYAANRRDLLAAQGFVHAQDRLWQLELNRRAAKGELCALLGPLPLPTDRLARTLGFGRLATASWEHLPEEARDDLRAYTAGTNAFLENRFPLPVEFSLVRHKPQRWDMLDCLAYGRLHMWALTTGAFAELAQAELIQRLGPEKAADLSLRYPAENPDTLPGGIEVNQWLIDGLAGVWTNPFLGKGAQDGAGRGSNGWVIGPERSASGRAILCNDMHLPLGVPSLWHFQHLHSEDGFHAAGFTLPGLPHVMVGRNGRIAWGATLSFVDCEDMFLEQLHPAGDGRYRFRDGWRQGQVIEEEIVIRGRPSHTERIILTHHGPLINQMLNSEQPIALNSIALRPDAAMDGFRLLNTAKNWDEFVTAVARIPAPSLNLLYADADGNIGHYVSGRVPIRQKGDGALPVPGWTGEHEWIGEIPFAEMPHALNPAQGYIVSANNRIVGDTYPYELGRMWRNGCRARRIEQLIAATPRVSPADCRRWQMDVFSLPGAALAAALADVEPTQPDAPLTLNLLRQWDGYLTPDSVGGAIYAVFSYEISRLLLAPHFDAPFLEELLGRGINPFLHPTNEFSGNWTAVLLQVLGDESHWLYEGMGRTAVIEEALARAAVFCRQKLGKNPAGWQWGRLHRVTFAHAFGLVPGLRRLFNLGPHPVGGDENTVAQSGFLPGQPYANNAVGVSSRFILDWGDPNKAQAILAPGQSGHPASPHYGDLIQPWLSGGYFRVVWGVEEVTAVTRHRLELRPRG
ncbi:MAG TPA: penicillin acylase family protein [Anaerolineae bacterium]|nr:penicillin acylase family protein [Anaerolineae bacterium]